MPAPTTLATPSRVRLKAPSAFELSRCAVVLRRSPGSRRGCRDPCAVRGTHPRRLILPRRRPARLGWRAVTRYPPARARRHRRGAALQLLGAGRRCWPSAPTSTTPGSATSRARSEVFGWRFELLAIASGLAIAAFALLLLPRLGALSPAVRRGVLALLRHRRPGGDRRRPAELRRRPRSLAARSPTTRFDVIHATANLRRNRRHGARLRPGRPRPAPARPAGAAPAARPWRSAPLWLLLTRADRAQLPAAPTSTRSKGSASAPTRCSSGPGWCCSGCGRPGHRGPAAELFARRRGGAGVGGAGRGRRR